MKPFRPVVPCLTAVLAMTLACPVHADPPCDKLLVPAEKLAELDHQRAEKIHQLFPAVPLDRIKIVGGMGRVDVFPDVDFSYYIQTAHADSADGEMTLIPMATTRLAPGYINTPEWWSAHQDKIRAAKISGQNLPFQDRSEVAAWLRKNGLSTNPPVYEIRGASVQKIPLQRFLLDQVLSSAKSDDVILYRGAERPAELSQWKSGIKPRGARYWTPDATYAWRYARKDPDFLPKLLRGESPVMVFRIPKSELKNLVDRGDLVLGTELTKNAHAAFDRGGRFEDHLVGSDFMGEGPIGVEIEVRGNSAGSKAFTRYFQRAATIEDLADQRIASIDSGTERLKNDQPWRAPQLDEMAQARIARVKAEESVLLALRNKAPAAEVNALYAALPPGRPELVNVDGFSLERLVREYKP